MTLLAYLRMYFASIYMEQKVVERLSLANDFIHTNVKCPLLSSALALRSPHPLLWPRVRPILCYGPVFAPSSALAPCSPRPVLRPCVLLVLCSDPLFVSHGAPSSADPDYGRPISRQRGATAVSVFCSAGNGTSRVHQRWTRAASDARSSPLLPLPSSLSSPLGQLGALLPVCPSGSISVPLPVRSGCPGLAGTQRCGSCIALCNGVAKLHK